MTFFDADVLTATPELAAWFEEEAAKVGWQAALAALKKRFGNEKEWPGEYGNKKPREHWPQEGAVQAVQIGWKVAKKLGLKAVWPLNNH